MLGRLLHQGRATELRVRVNEFVGTQGRAAFLALIAIGTFGTTFRACAHNISVGKELLTFGVEILFRLLLDELSFIVEFLEELLGRGTVHLRRGTGIDIITDAQFLERLLDNLVVTVDDILWRTAFLLGLDGNRHSVLVGTTDKQHFLATHSQIANVCVGRDIDAGKVTDVDRAIGVGQGRGYCVTLESVFTD